MKVPGKQSVIRGGRGNVAVSALVAMVMAVGASGLLTAPAVAEESSGQGYIVTFVAGRAAPPSRRRSRPPARSTSISSPPCRMHAVHGHRHRRAPRLRADATGLVRRARPQVREAQGDSRSTRRTPTSGRCRRSAGTRRSGRSSPPAPRPSPSSTPASTPRTTSPATSSPAPRCSMASPGPTTRNGHGTAMAEHRRRRTSTTASASPVSATRASTSCPSRSSAPTASARTPTSSRASSTPPTTAPTSSSCRSPTPAPVRRSRLRSTTPGRRAPSLVAATGNDGPPPRPTRPASPRSSASPRPTGPTRCGPAQTPAPTPSSLPPESIIATDAGTVTGTSASAAIVAGAAALVKANDPAASNGVVVGRLARTADAAGTADQTGNGRVNLARALSDDSAGALVPEGVAGSGGPVVGPYRLPATPPSRVRSRAPPQVLPALRGPPSRASRTAPIRR